MLGFKVEHHKNGQGEYEWHWSGDRNDGKVREKMDDQTLRQKDDADGNANERVGKKYKEKAGHYNLLTDNCQHASNEAYEAADPKSCSLM